MTECQPSYTPSPSQIQEACEQIQSEWSEAERLRRLRHDWRHDEETAQGWTVEAASTVTTERTTHGSHTH